MSRFTLILLALLALLLGACGQDAPLPIGAVDPNDPTLLRVYEVAPEKATEIRQALRGVLGNEESGHGSVSQLADGRLLVLAPLTLQASIEEALEQLDAESKGSGPSPTTAVRLQYWIVDADAGATADDPTTAPIGAALEATRAALGNSYFVMHDMLSVTASLDGESASATTGRHTKIESKLRPASQGVRAELDIHAAGGSALRTTTTLPFDQTVVLAQLSAAAASSSNEPGPQRARLYVVRAERVDQE